MTNILIMNDMHEFMKYFKQHKIKHGPITKIKNEKGRIFHACDITNVNDMALIALVFTDKYNLPLKGESYYNPGYTIN